MRDAMDLIANGDFGSACISTLSVKGLPPGTLLLEAYFSPAVRAPASLQLDRYLPAHSERLLMDLKGRNLADKVSHQQLNGLCQNLKRSLIPALMRQIREPLTALLNTVEKNGKSTEEDWRHQALTNYNKVRDSERRRLQALAQRNPDIGEHELLNFDSSSEQGQKYLSQLQLNLNALRLAIVS